MKWLGCLMGVAWVACAVMESAGCIQPFTAGTGGAGSGSSGSSSAPSEGVATSSNSSSGTGGAPCTAGSCPSGDYCRADTNVCEPCAGSARFQFATPVAVSVTLPTLMSGALFPRVKSDTGDLFLVQQDSTHHDQIALAPSTGRSSWGAAMVLSQAEGATMYQYSGPLYLEDPSILGALVDPSVAKSGMPALLFDSDRLVTDHKVFAVTLDGTQIGPMPVTLPGNASYDASIAVAMTATPARFWWISDATAPTGDAGPALGDAGLALGDAGPGVKRLVTATVSDAFPRDVVIMLDDDCPASPTAPWVTPAGDRLFFMSPRAASGSGCVVSEPNDTRLYQVPLGSAGMPSALAQPVFADATSVDSDPALEPDQCTLLFSRTDASGTNVYSAARD